MPTLKKRKMSTRPKIPELKRSISCEEYFNQLKPYTKKKISYEIKTFACKLYKKISKNCTVTGNFFISALNTCIPVAMIYDGIDDQCKHVRCKKCEISDIISEGKSTLIGRNCEEFRRIVDILKSRKYLTIKNIFSHDKEVAIDEDYKKKILELGSDIMELDITGDIEESKKKLRKITKSVHSVNQDSKLPFGEEYEKTKSLITSSFHFKGYFLFGYETVENKTVTFEKNENLHIEEMLYRRHCDHDGVKYMRSECLEYEAVELPLRGGYISLVLIKQFDGENIISMSDFEKMLDNRFIDEMMKNMNYIKENTELDVYMPKIKIKTSSMISDTLKKIGLKTYDESPPEENAGKNIKCPEIFNCSSINIKSSMEGFGGYECLRCDTMTGVEKEVIRFKASLPFIFVLWDTFMEVPLGIGRYAEYE